MAEAVAHALAADAALLGRDLLLLHRSVVTQFPTFRLARITGTGGRETANPMFSNIVKDFANQNVCFSCGFDIGDRHNSTTCTNRKPGHQIGFTCSNWQEYERANHQFCRKAMHKTMYPSA